ncbi:MAG: hypothetical protein P8I94_06680 [Emcibacteraceae bacterium]|nr:hypothetical protein [Emcibacteraceae bacterium]
MSEYQNLDTALVEILPAQGSGKIIIPVSVIVTADRATTETSNQRLIFGDSTTYTTVAGEFFAEIRGFMYNEAGDKSYSARPARDLISRGLMNDRPFNVYASGSFAGDVDVVIYFSYQVMDV